MQEITAPIGDIFKLLERYENINFTPEQEQFLDSKIQIKDEHSNWVNITAGITKKDTGREVIFNNGASIRAANKHKIHNGDGCVFFESLGIGDIIRDAYDNTITVAEINNITDAIFYDFNVDTSTHLYQTTNGIVHHNTEVTKLLSDNLDMNLLRYDMSEYQERHSVSALIGPPPGYVGYEDGVLGGGKLIADISKDPFSIILFDEIEKAHPDVTNIMLQMLDEGHITGSSGKKVNVTNCIIIMTSNLGAQDNEQNTIGFSTPLKRTGEEDKAVKQFFKPELRNRIDAIVKFQPLDGISIKKVVVKFINELSATLKSRGITLTASEELIEHIATIGYDSKMGARPISRKIDDLIRVPLSKKLLFKNVKDSNVHLDYEDDEIKFKISSIHHSVGTPVLNEDGLQVLDQFKPE
jgi:hypothetical protein